MGCKLHRGFESLLLRGFRPLFEPGCLALAVEAEIFSAERSEVANSPEQSFGRCIGMGEREEMLKAQLALTV